jgi:SAM-dependent methyltransferase
VDTTGATRRSYDAVAEDYAREIADELRGKPLDRAVLDAFAETAPAGPVADLGCGPGHVAAYLRARGLSTVGLDLAPAMCAVAGRDAGLPAAAGDLAALPIRSGSLAGAVCLYAVIHLDPERRAAAYRELARVLAAGGLALVAFHVGDAELAPGGSRTLSTWWDHDVDLTFRFLDPAAEIAELGGAGLTTVARVEREPYAGVEHPSRRCVLLVERR